MRVVLRASCARTYFCANLGNIVLETDSPYLTPVPYRGKRNDPSHVWEISEYIANLKGVSVEELSKETNANITRCFDI